MRDKNFEQRKEFLRRIREAGGPSKVDLVHSTTEYQLVEDNVTKYINALNKRNVETIGFTARRTGKATSTQDLTVEEYTETILYTLNIQFNPIHISDCSINMSSTSANDSRYEPFKYSNGVLVSKGVIFTNNYNKGHVLNEIFNIFNFTPKTFVMFDDKFSNLESISDVIRSYNTKHNLSINFLGYHYIGADLLDNTVDPNIVRIQEERILQNNSCMLTDSEAYTLYHST